MENSFAHVDLSRFQKAKAHAPRSAREELLETFRARLNLERVGTKFKPLTHVAVKMKLAHVPDRDLYPFLAECEKARSFSRFFYWALKPKVDEKYQ